MPAELTVTVPPQNKAKTLSTLQRDILAYFEQYDAQYRRAPTIREIGQAVNQPSTSVISYNLGILVDRGDLARDGSGSRAYYLPDAAIRADPLKLLTDVHARIVSGQDAVAVVLDTLLNILLPSERAVFNAIAALPGADSRNIQAATGIEYPVIYTAIQRLLAMKLIDRRINTSGHGFTYTVKAAT